MKNEWKGKYLSSHFLGTAIFLIALFVLHFYLKSLTVWAWSVCIFVSSFSFSRALSKRNVPLLRYKGYLSREFYLSILGIGIILYPVFEKRLRIEDCIISISVIWAAYNFSRGYTQARNDMRNNVI